MTILYIIGGILVWAGIGVLTLRAMVHFTEAPDSDDENFFLGLAVIFGPIFTVVAIVITLGVMIYWLGNHIGMFKALRKAAGFHG